MLAVAGRADRALLERAWRRAFPRLRLTGIGRFVAAGKTAAGSIDLQAFHGSEHLR